MAQGRSTQVISSMKWIWTSRLSIKNSLFTLRWRLGFEQQLVLQGYLAHKKQRPPRTLQWDYA
jgi:hypothetical protein